MNMKVLTFLSIFTLINSKTSIIEAQNDPTIGSVFNGQLVDLGGVAATAGTTDLGRVLGTLLVSSARGTGSPDVLVESTGGSQTSTFSQSSAVQTSTNIETSSLVNTESSSFSNTESATNTESTVSATSNPINTNQSTVAITSVTTNNNTSSGTILTLSTGLENNTSTAAAFTSSTGITNVTASSTGFIGNFTSSTGSTNVSISSTATIGNLTSTGPINTTSTGIVFTSSTGSVSNTTSTGVFVTSNENVTTSIFESSQSQSSSIISASTGNVQSSSINIESSSGENVGSTGNNFVTSNINGQSSQIIQQSSQITQQSTGINNSNSGNNNNNSNNGGNSGFNNNNNGSSGSNNNNGGQTGSSNTNNNNNNNNGNSGSNNTNNNNNNNNNNNSGSNNVGTSTGITGNNGGSNGNVNNQTPGVSGSQGSTSNNPTNNNGNSQTNSNVTNTPGSGTTQTSPSTGVCPAIQFIQTPTNSDVTFTAQTTRSIAWVDVHINVLNGNQTPYPSNAPVENNSWFWNYRMTKVSDKTFNFQYTTGPNGFNFDPSKQSLQYFFTYSSDLADCNTQSFIYSPSNLVSPSIGALVSNINQPQTATTPTNNGVCPVFSFNYNVFPVDSTYEVDFAPQTTRTVEFVDIHFNVLSIGQSPYPANAIVEANNWFWNYRMNKVNDNLFTFKLPTGQNGVNFDSSKSLQFFFTYCTEEIDCNTQSFVFNTNSGALEAPPAPQPQLPSQQTGNQEQSQQTAQQQQPSSSQPNNQHSQQNYNNQNQTPPPTTPPTQNGLTFCEKYSQQLFSNSQSDCYQTALFAGIVNRAVYGSSNVNPSVTGAYAQASPVWNFFNGSIPYNGQQYQLQQLINHSNNNDKFGPILTQTLIEFMGRLFGCKSSGFPAFSSNPDFANSGYTYPDINALRNVIKGLNLPKSFYDSINTSIIQSMKSFGVSDDDINSIVIPTISGFENGLIGQSVYQQSKVTEDHNNNNQKESSAVTKYLVSISMIALPAVMALLF